MACERGAVFEIVAHDLGLHTPADVLRYADTLGTDTPVRDRCVLRWVATQWQDAIDAQMDALDP